jgi:hypothetical protein
MKTETLIKSAAPYYLLKVTPQTGKAFYAIGRDGKIISRSFTSKRNATKMLKLVSRKMLSDSPVALLHERDVRTLQSITQEAK